MYPVQAAPAAPTSLGVTVWQWQIEVTWTMLATIPTYEVKFLDCDGNAITGERYIKSSIPGVDACFVPKNLESGCYKASVAAQLSNGMTGVPGIKDFHVYAVRPASVCC